MAMGGLPARTMHEDASGGDNVKDQALALAEKPQKRQKTEPTSLVYIVRWAAHGSNVDEWEHGELSNIETSCHEIEEAMGYITGEVDVGDPMLLADGLRKDDGMHPKAYSTVERAREGMKDCHSARVEKMRDAIMKRCGIGEESYRDLLENEKFFENTDGEGSFPPSAKVLAASGSGGGDDGAIFLDPEIAWGASRYNDSEANNKKQHEFIRCCVCITTGVTCWIESLELVG